MTNPGQVQIRRPSDLVDYGHVVDNLHMGEADRYRHLAATLPGQLRTLLNSRNVPQETVEAIVKEVSVTLVAGCTLSEQLAANGARIARVGEAAVEALRQSARTTPVVRRSPSGYVITGV